MVALVPVVDAPAVRVLAVVVAARVAVVRAAQAAVVRAVPVAVMAAVAVATVVAAAPRCRSARGAISSRT